MEELTKFELISIGALLRTEIVRTKCYIDTFGDEDEFYAKELERLESTYKKIEAMIARARCGKEGGEDGVLP